MLELSLTLLDLPASLVLAQCQQKALGDLQQSSPPGMLPGQYNAGKHLDDDAWHQDCPSTHVQPFIIIVIIIIIIFIIIK